MVLCFGEKVDNYSVWALKVQFGGCGGGPPGRLPVSAEKPNLLTRERYTVPALPSAYIRHLKCKLNSLPTDPTVGL